MKAGTLNRLIRIERPVRNASFKGAGSGKWELVAEVRAEVQDVLPSRGERLSEGMTIATRPARVRVLFRDGITSDMRFLIGRMLIDENGDPAWHTDRTVQIVAGPAEIGLREGLEFMVEEYRPAGNPA